MDLLLRQVKNARAEPANNEENFCRYMRAHFVSRAKNINMADETNESCSFHEMGLDDRLVKVNYILVIKIDQNCSF